MILIVHLYPPTSYLLLVVRGGKSSAFSVNASVRARGWLFAAPPSLSASARINPPTADAFQVEVFHAKMGLDNVFARRFAGLHVLSGHPLSLTLAYESIVAGAEKTEAESERNRLGYESATKTVSIGKRDTWTQSAGFSALC